MSQIHILEQELAEAKSQLSEASRKIARLESTIRNLDELVFTLLRRAAVRDRTVQPAPAEMH